MAHQGRDKRPYVKCELCNDTGCNECTCSECGEYLRRGEVTTCDKCKADEEEEYGQVE